MRVVDSRSSDSFDSKNSSRASGIPLAEAADNKYALSLNIFITSLFPLLAGFLILVCTVKNLNWNQYEYHLHS